MVHRMDSSNFSSDCQNSQPKGFKVKPELDEFTGDDDDSHLLQQFSLSKRPRLDLSLQSCDPNTPVSPVEYDPLEEPSPLGLKLKKSPSFLDLIQMKLGQEKSVSLGKTLPRREKDQHNHKKGSSSSTASASVDKLKASNFPATLLRIGTWEYKSRYEGDLVAKCYFAKHKLVWEVLDGGLKNKIEIQWSDIMAIKATYSEDGPETLDVVLGRQPLFFREINPQPRKHTLWQATSDFTGGQATVYRRHFLQCAQGLLGKHFEKLVQCDPRLNFLSQQPEIVLDNPFFEPKNSVFGGGHGKSGNAFDLKTESGYDVPDLRDTATTSGICSRVERKESMAALMELNTQGTPTTLTSDICIMQGQAGERLKEIDNLKILDQIKLPGLHPSMSMSDLVNHIGQCISEQINPDVPINEEQKTSILEDIAQYLLSDSQVTPIVNDEKSIMSRVNSLCCLLQKDPISTVQNLHAKSEHHVRDLFSGRIDAVEEDPNKSSSIVPHANSLAGDNNLCRTEHLGNELNVKDELRIASSTMSRKDSVGDLLLNLPRIASLPRFLYNFGDDYSK